MSYQVIARKWRPQSFDQLVGQNHISTTLINALRNDRLPHALLFTGPRGTGKTTSARILAKSLRCSKAVDFVPCNQCNDCEEIARSMSPNVLEIDGASNNGVDAVRDLRDGVAYAPSTGRFKVYIIDEVHMLSTAAFNALLKTLEEPPAHVVFIMATTEVQKIPQTILSRCQRFDFRRIPTRQIADSLKSICQKENVAADEDAIWMIARQADGSMRDSQSLLDQVITFANGKLSRENVSEILGLTDHAMLLEMLSALVRRDADAVLAGLSQLNKSGSEPVVFANDLLQNIRNLLLSKIGDTNKTSLPILDLPDSELRFFKELAHNISAEDVHMLFDMALKGAGDINRSSEPMLVLEMVLLRIAAAPQIVDLQSLLSGAANVSVNTAMTSAASSQAPQVPRTAAPAVPKAQMPAKSSEKSGTTTAATPSQSSMHQSPTDRWFELVQNIKSKEARLGAKIEPLQFVGVQDNGATKVLQLAAPAKMAFLKEQLLEAQQKQHFQSLIEQFWGTGYTVEIRLANEASVGPSAQSIAQEQEAQQNEKVALSLKEHPKVKAATRVFKGQVTSIRDSGSKN